MGETSKIAWTDGTWNPVLGCSKVSEGCNHCYAETLATRYGWTKKPWAARFAEENVQMKPGKLTLPLTPKWAEPKMVFVNSMSDVFHEQIPDDYIDMMWGVMAVATQHTFQILTKRPERQRDYMNDLTVERIKRGALAALKPSKVDQGINNVMSLLKPEYQERLAALTSPILPNVWLGTSVENRKWADVRIPILQETQAAVRFLSCEPLLDQLVSPSFGTLIDVARTPSHLDLSGIDWVIVGGESGPLHRPYKMEWARDIRDECRDQHVAFFYKQSDGYKSGLHPFLTEDDGSCWTYEQYPGNLAAPVMDHAHQTALPL